MKTTIFKNASEAIYDIKDGATILMNGIVGPGGAPQNLIRALYEKGTKNLTLIISATGLIGGLVQRKGMPEHISPGVLIENGQIRKVIATSSRRSLSSTMRKDVPAIERAVLDGSVEWEPTTHGLLAERIRTGAAGLGGFYSPVGIGTILERGKEKKIIKGKEYLLETPLRGDFALVRAFKADKLGNLIYKGTSRAYNPVIAMAADVTIAEVEDIVEVGEIDAEHIITPFVFVDRMFKIS
jgi:3-oxoacid CoA-transferase subunit A